MKKALPPLIAALFLGGTVFATQAAQWSKVEYAGLLDDDALEELSGLASSRRTDGLLWGHNDGVDARKGDSGARLMALRPSGDIIGVHTVRGARNIDWEDMASVRIDGRDYLVVADIGDNGGLRETLTLYLIPEPETADGDAPLNVERTIEFRWPDGPRDCEAIVVDPLSREILLVSKKRVPPELFRLSWDAKPGVQTAELLGTLAGIEQPNAEQLKKNPTFGRYRSQITAADLSPNGRVLAVLNYERVYLFSRKTDEPWSKVLQRQPAQLRMPWVPQAEALAFSRDGLTLYIGSEQRPSPILKFSIKR